MQHSFKRILSLVLTLVMVLSCVPAGVFAAETCDHNYEATVTEPTCTENGSIDYVCSLCGDSFQEPGGAAAGHDYQETDTAEATCIQAGSVTYECAVCGDSVTEEIPATGEHSYADGVCAGCGAEDPDAAPAEELTELPAPEPMAAEEDLDPNEDGGDVLIPQKPNYVAQLGEDGDRFESLAEAVAAAADIATDDRPFVAVLQDCEVTETIRIDTDINIFYIGGDGNNPTVTAAEGVDTLFEIQENSTLLVNNVDFVNTGDYVIRLAGDRAHFQTVNTNVSGAAKAAVSVDSGVSLASIGMQDGSLSGAVALELNGTGCEASFYGENPVLTGDSSYGAVVLNGSDNFVEIPWGNLYNSQDIAFTMNGDNCINVCYFNDRNCGAEFDPMHSNGAAARFEQKYFGNLEWAFDEAALVEYDEQYPDRTLNIDVMSDLAVTELLQAGETDYPVRLIMLGDQTLTIAEGGDFSISCDMEIVGNLTIQQGGTVFVSSGTIDMAQANITAPDGSITLLPEAAVKNMDNKKPVCRIYNQVQDEAALRAALEDFQNEGYGAAEIIPRNDITLADDLVNPANVTLYLIRTLTVPAEIKLENYGRIIIDGGKLDIQSGAKLEGDGKIDVENGGIFNKPQSDVTLTAKVNPAVVTTAADAEGIQISVDARDDQNRRITDLTSNYVITDAEDETVELEDAVQTPGIYTITPTYTSNSKYNVTVVPATLTVKDAEYVCVNTATGETYESVSAALAAAGKGDMIKLLSDYTCEEIWVKPGVTLDLNGKVLKTGYVIGQNGSNVVDNTRKGLLEVESTNITLSTTNSETPIRDNDLNGYRFGKYYVDDTSKGLGIAVSEGIINYSFVTMQSGGVKSYFLDGITDNEIQVIVKATWKEETGDRSHVFYYNDTQVGLVAAGGNKYTFAMKGYEDLEDLRINAMVETECHVENSTAIHYVESEQ